MADFDVVVSSGASMARWTDPASKGGKPSRLGSHPGRPQLYWLGKLGVPIVIQAVVAGVTGPLDTALGGRLFAPSLPEGFGPPLFSAVAGQSAVVTWTPTGAGHHVVSIWRPSGGAMLIHFDIAA